jgi:hypothetical protein
MEGGVLWRDVLDACYKSAKRWEVWTIDTTPAQDALVDQFIHETEGDLYDWRAIVSFGMGERDWRAPHRRPRVFICSEWAMSLLERVGLARLPAKVPVNRITPRDVYMIFPVLIGVQKDAVYQAELSPLFRQSTLRGLHPRLAPLVPAVSFDGPVTGGGIPSSRCSSISMASTFSPNG